MTTAILGAAGQLGRALTDRLTGDVVALTRGDVDLTNPPSLDRLRRINPAVVYNCAAYNHVDRAESEPAQAFAVNAFGVRDLARLCAEVNCLLVHFSTDYVFGLDGERTDPYRETDAPGPLGVYAASKLCGEYFVRALCRRHLVVRTCGLYGEGGNFVKTMLRLARQKKTIRVVNDQICTPTSASDLAAAAIRLTQTDSCGLFHLTNTGSCSWHQFAQAIFDEAGPAADLQPCTSADYGAAARRPSFSALGTVHNRAALGVAMRPWREALADYVAAVEEMDRA